MTTNVPKGSGRATATANRNKHAQRTPLPPKKGSPGAEAILEAKIDAWAKTSGLPPEAIEAMKEEARKTGAKTVEEALAAWEDLGDGGDETTIPTPEKPMGERPVVELRKIASGLLVPGARSMKKGELLNAILLAERAQESTAKRLAGRDLAAEVFETAAKSTPTTRAHGKTTDHICDRPSLDSAQGKSMAKAEAFLTAAAELGWTEVVRSSPEQETYGVIVGRGEERIAISWRSGVFMGEECYHSHPGRSPRKVINASAAKKLMAIPPVQAAEEAAKVSAHKASRPRRDRSAQTTTERRKALPFDPETASDEDVLQAVSGGNRRVSWTNEVSGTIEDAYITGSVSIQPGKSGRSLRFTSMTGFRSVRVSSIIAIR
jgi:hypothetical protein